MFGNCNSKNSCLDRRVVCCRLGLTLYKMSDLSDAGSYSESEVHFLLGIELKVTRALINHSQLSVITQIKKSSHSHVQE